MTYRKTDTILYRILTLVTIVAVAALSWLAISFAVAKPTHAEDVQPHAETQPTHDSVFGASHAKSKAFSLSDEEVVYVERSKYTGSVSYYLRSGTYHLTEDISLGEPLELNLGVLQWEKLTEDDDITINICLHGHSIAASKSHVFEVLSDSSLNIYDCGGADNCGTMSSSRGVYVSGGTFNMYGGTISGGDGYNGISVAGGGTFNMYGGAIKNNSGGSSDPGGVFIGSGTFNMYGGEISNNTTQQYGGAGVCLDSYNSVFHMYGGSITNNVLDCSKAYSDESIPLFYYGAGVKFGTGTFSIEGDVNISGNIRRYKGEDEINNLGINDDCKIDVTGKLGANAKIGISASKGVITNGYTTAGNTEAPSKYFAVDGGIDSGLKIGLDSSTGKEVAVLDSNDPGTYKMQSAVVTGAAAAKVGDTKVKFTIDVTLVNTADSLKTQTQTEVYEHTLSSRLKSGTNKISFNYMYQGVTKALSYDVVPAKYSTYIVWSCSGTQRGQNEYRRAYDGTDVKDTVRATYTGYDGEQVHVEGMTERVILQDDNGNTVTSTAKPGIYYFHLVESDEYEFSNNSLKLEVVATDNVIYKLKDAAVKGIIGTPSIGDTTIKVRIELTLVDADDATSEKKQTVEHTITPDIALKIGQNTVNFKYTYGDDSKDLSVTFEVSKKSVYVEWYCNDVLVNGNKLQHVYDGNDAISNIVAKYDGIDGKKQTVAASSNNVIKKKASGENVTSLKDVGEYTLTLAADENYEFNNNLFTYTVVEKLSDISDLVYEEQDEVILGVSSEDGFESGTEVVVEKVNDLDDNLVSGTISSALNVTFVNNSVEVTPIGIITVRVLIPDELKGTTNYKIYNLNNGVATQVRFTTDGTYAIFESDQLNTILFVTEETPPVIDPITPDTPVTPDKPVNNEITLNIDGSGLVWLWVFLGIVGACAIAVTVALIVKFKRDKNKK